MGSSDYGEAGPHIYEIAEELWANSTIHGDPYTNILVDTTETGFASMHDPEIRVQPDAETLFWPGGSPVHGGNFETVTLLKAADTHQLAAEATAIRNALLAASIGDSALGRVPQHIQAAWKENKNRIAPTPPILYAMERCARLVLPLAVCQTSIVAESQTIPAGMRVMHLWYPTYLSPKPVLATLRRVVRKAIEAETL